MKRIAMALVLCAALPLIACGQQIAEQDITHDITPAPLLVLTTTVPAGQMSVLYPPFVFQAQGGLLPYLWDIVTGTCSGVPCGTLPPGLTLAADGTLSGMPTTTGSFGYRVRVTDNGGNAAIMDIQVGAGRRTDKPTG